MTMCDDSLLLPRESVEAQLRSCLAYRREHPDWRGRSLRLAYSLLHWWDERDAAVNDCLDRQRTIDDLRVVLAEALAALHALEQCCSWSDTMQQWTLVGRERTQAALQAARKALAGSVDYDRHERIERAARRLVRAYDADDSDGRGWASEAMGELRRALGLQAVPAVPRGRQAPARRRARRIERTTP
jgi:hypothetical protein